MPTPRKSQISLAETPYYHCVSRCVRRAFLCGTDKFTGQSYEHRRGWVEQRLLKLAKVFAIDVCAYAVMSNHTHVVLHVDKHKALSWTTEEVLHRWHMLHRGTILTRKFLSLSQRQTMSEAEIKTVGQSAKIYRERLYDISWFMRLLNEYIARQANKEDDCTGRFWEGRFKSQALMDETALAACMVYVDLNPVRANIAANPEQSDYTSIQKRIEAARLHKQPRDLFPFTGPKNQRTGHAIPFCLQDYLQLVKDTARHFDTSRYDKVTGFKDIKNLPVLKQAGLSAESWHLLITGVETQFSTRICLATIRRKLSQHKKRKLA
jgi:REP element-mobilizing transposase RayT